MKIEGCCAWYQKNSNDGSHGISAYMESVLPGLRMCPTAGPAAF